MPKDELTETVLRLRNESFPDVPESLVTLVLEIEQQHPENRLEARRLIEAAIMDQLRSEGHSC